MLLEELERLEHVPPVPLDASKFPYYFNSTDITTEESLELFDMELIADSLQVNQILEPIQPYHPRASKAPLDIPSLMHFSKMDKAPTFAFKRNLQTGQLDLAEITETIESNVGDSRISTNLNREPSSKTDFVRGNSSNLPFTPGGMTIDPHKQVNLVSELDELETIAPGLDRGIDFIQSKSGINVLNIFSGHDNLLQDYLVNSDMNIVLPSLSTTEKAEINQKMDKDEKDVDNILFQNVVPTNID